VVNQTVGNVPDRSALPRSDQDLSGTHTVAPFRLFIEPEETPRVLVVGLQARLGQSEVFLPGLKSFRL